MPLRLSQYSILLIMIKTNKGKGKAMLDNIKAFSSYSVDSVEKGKRFYSEILGLQVTDVSGMKGLINLKIANDFEVMLYEKSDHIPATFTVLNFIVKDIQKTVDDLGSKGVKFKIYDLPNLKTDSKGILRGNGPTIAWFKDPAGNILSVIEENK